MADSSRIVTAEVADGSLAYKEYTDEKTGITHPRGVIKIKMFSTRNRSTRIDYAYPLNATTFSVPITGEQVTCIRMYADNASPFVRKKVWYYLQSVNTFDNLSINRFLGLNQINPVHKHSYDDKAIVYQNSLTTLDEENSSKMQPYVGDIIYQSRYSSAIRFGSSNTKDSGIYEISNPPWRGDNNDSPIVTITNGYDNEKETYTIEDPEKDKSLIYLTSDQTIRTIAQTFPSQSNIGRKLTRIGTYKDSQVIISADRLFFNSRDDSIILSAKKTVSVATPNWAMDMNEFFTMFEDFIDEMMKTARGESTYTTGVGPTGPNPALIAGLTKLKTKLIQMKQ